MFAVLLDGDHGGAAARQEFEADASRAAEEVEGARLFEVEIGAQHVKEVFLGKVRRGACAERRRYLEVSALVLSGDDSHEACEEGG